MNRSRLSLIALTILAPLCVLIATHGALAQVSLDYILANVTCTGGPVTVGGVTYPASCSLDVGNNGYSSNTINQSYLDASHAENSLGGGLYACANSAVLFVHGCGAGTLNDECAPSCTGNQGGQCTSSPNSCGQVTWGTVNCDGSCSAPQPSDSSCSPPPPPPPSCSFSASPSQIDIGQSLSISWSCQGANSCTAANNADGFSTGGQTSGSSSAHPSAAGTVTYGMSCSGSGSATFYTNPITVSSPQASISASSLLVQANTSSTISWNASGVRSCSVTGPGLSSSSLTGSQSISIANQSTFQITCQTNSSPITHSLIVNVVPKLKEF